MFQKLLDEWSLTTKEYNFIEFSELALNFISSYYRGYIQSTLLKSKGGIQICRKIHTHKYTPVTNSKDKIHCMQHFLKFFSGSSFFSLISAKG